MRNLRHGNRFGKQNDLYLLHCLQYFFRTLSLPGKHIMSVITPFSPSFWFCSSRRFIFHCFQIPNYHSKYWMISVNCLQKLQPRVSAQPTWQVRLVAYLKKDPRTIVRGTTSIISFVELHPRTLSLRSTVFRSTSMPVRCQGNHQNHRNVVPHRLRSLMV